MALSPRLIVPSDIPVAGARGRRAMVFGDSISAFNSDVSVGVSLRYMARGYLTALQQQWGQRLYFSPSLNKAVGGNSTADMTARFDADVMAAISQFDIAFILGGTNDPSAPVAKEATVANLKLAATRLLTAGKTVVLMTILPRNSTTWTVDATLGLNFLLYVNQCLRDWYHNEFNPSLYAGRLILADTFSALVDPQSATGNPLANTMTDGLHPSAYGAQLLGAYLKALLSPFVPPAPTKMWSMGDAYSAAQNPRGNMLTTRGHFNGTGGSLSSAATGAIATGYTARLGGSSTFTSAEMVLSKESPGAAPYPGDRQVIAFAPVGKTSQEQAQMSVDVSSDVTAGVPYFAECELEVSNLVNCYELSILLQDRNGSTARQTATDNRYTSNTDYLQYAPGTILTLRTPIIIPDAFTLAAGLRAYISVACNATVSGSATVKAGAMVIRPAA